MRFLCDSDVDGPLVKRLRGDGHEVSYMTEIKADSTDDEVLAMAKANQAVLITRDKGFGQLVFQQGSASYGVLLVRVAGVPMADRAELLVRAVQQYGNQFAGAFSVLTPAGLRIRPRLG